MKAKKTKEIQFRYNVNFVKKQVDFMYTVLFNDSSYSGVKGTMSQGYWRLGQLFAKIITQCLFTYTKWTWIIMKKISIKQISWGSTNHNNVLGDFGRQGVKTWKIGPIFSSFNPRPSLSSVATDDRKQCQCLNINLNNKTGPLLLEQNWCEDTF